MRSARRCSPPGTRSEDASHSDAPDPVDTVWRPRISPHRLASSIGTWSRNQHARRSRRRDRPRVEHLDPDSAERIDRLMALAEGFQTRTADVIAELQVPRSIAAKPDLSRLQERYEEFSAAG